jgi:hypothetical protein
LIGHTLVYTALQGKSDATLPGMEKGNASSLNCLRVLMLFCEIDLVRSDFPFAAVQISVGSNALNHFWFELVALSKN